MCIRDSTAGLWTKGPEPTALCRKDAGVPLPSLVTPVADEGEFTHAILLTMSAWSMRFVPTGFQPSDVARGCTLVPLTLVWDLSSIPNRYLIDWGVCPENVP